MKYTIKSVHGDKYIYESKLELFNDFDNLAYKHGKLKEDELRTYIGEDFQIGKEGAFSIDIESFDKLIRGEYQRIVKKLRFNYLYVIYDQFGCKINVDKILDEYIQSRDLVKKARSSYIYDRSSNKSRKLRKNGRWSSTPKNSGLKKEYQDSFYPDEYSIKIRKKRLDTVKGFHIFYCGKRSYSKNTKSWKYNRKNQFK